MAVASEARKAGGGEISSGCNHPTLSATVGARPSHACCGSHGVVGSYPFPRSCLSSVAAIRLDLAHHASGMNIQTMDLPNSGRHSVSCAMATCLLEQAAAHANRSRRSLKTPHKRPRRFGPGGHPAARGAGAIAETREGILRNDRDRHGARRARHLRADDGAADANGLERSNFVPILDLPALARFRLVRVLPDGYRIVGFPDLIAALVQPWPRWARPALGIAYGRVENRLILSRQTRVRLIVNRRR